MHNIQRLTELLNDALKFASEGKTASTKVSRAEDGLHRIIPLIRQTDPYAISNLADLELYLQRVIRTAQAVESFNKARASKMKGAQKKHYQSAAEALASSMPTDVDFAALGLHDPISGVPLTRDLIQSAAHESRTTDEVLTAEVVGARKQVGQDKQLELADLLTRDHTLNGGILFGIDGYIVEIQARAVEVLRKPIGWSSAAKISGMANGAIRESLDRISGAFSKLQIEDPQVRIMINLAPADLPKEGTWLDLPLAIILLQAAGYLPDLPEHMEGDFVLMGELGLHGEVRRVPGALSLAYIARAGQSLIVPTGNEKECALIMAKPGHEGCRVCPVSTLDEVIDFFKGKRQLDNALKQKITLIAPSSERMTSDAFEDKRRRIKPLLLQ